MFSLLASGAVDLGFESLSCVMFSFLASNAVDLGFESLSCVMFSLLASSAVDLGFESLSCVMFSLLASSAVDLAFESLSCVMFSTHDRDSNPRSTAPEASKLNITPRVRLVNYTVCSCSIILKAWWRNNIHPC
jgi:hypothetical protein